MVDKRCVSTRSVQLSGNHHKYYIGWALVINCSLTDAYQTFRGACCFLLHSWSEQGGDTDTLYTQGARKSQSDAHAAEKTMVNRTYENHASNMDLLPQWTWLATLQPAYITWVHRHPLHFHLLNIRSISKTTQWYNRESQFKNGAVKT